MTEQNPTLVNPITFCTVKYNKHYLVLSDTTGNVLAFPNQKTYERMWRRKYVELLRRGHSIESLQNHFSFFQPMLHNVKDITQFEEYVTPMPRRVVSAEYISGNCIGLTCDNDHAEKYREITGIPVKVNFKLAVRAAEGKFK